MIKNYLLIGLRNLRKHLGYSVINILGLSLGLATCLLLVLWITHELSYDKFHNKADRLYRVSLEYSFGGQIAKTPVSPTALLPALFTLSETETGTRVYNPSAWSPYIVRYGDKMFQEDHFYMADSTFFKVFTYNLLKGNAARALVMPNSVVLTKTAAQKYFGDVDPMGKLLEVNQQEYTVTGLMEDPPSNSFLKFDFVGSFSSLAAAREEPIWWSANYQTFYVAHPQANMAIVAEKINDIVKRAVAKELTTEGDYVRYNFMLLKDIHLKSSYDNEPEVVGDIKYIYIFSAIAALILIIACINYVNLATARATDRAKEVGIRKVAGALRQQLFIQFIGESLIISLASFVVAYLLAGLLLPFFNVLTGKEFLSTDLFQPSFIGASFVALIAIGILAGAYPAFAITAFKPVTVLKGNFKTSGKGIWLRKSLVVFQFGTSIVLIVGTLVIVKQLRFIQAKKLGYDRENVIMLPLDSKTKETFDPLKTELLRSVATAVGRGSESPSHVQGGYAMNTAGGAAPGIIITGLIVDEDYIPAMSIEIIAGRNFTKQDLIRVEKDSVNFFILNEAALAQLYITKEDAIGQRVQMGERVGEVLGVVKDFHFSSLHKNIGPLVMFPEASQLDQLFIKLKAGNLPAQLAQVQDIYTTLISHRPFEFEFLDQQYASLYAAEQRMSKVFIVFATLAIVIACLGLLGLVSFSTAQKTKEIGIRKVMGATAVGIVLLLTKDFIKLVLVAIVLGLPLAHWLMGKWLANFAYKTYIGLWPVIFAAFLCIIIAFGTAVFQAVKAAFINPVDALRNE